MPKNKFNAFYYGVGLKLDEASVDKVGQQLEGKLNQVVDKVIGEVSNLSDALSKGIGHLDTKELVKSLKDAKEELGQFQNFDPSKLQGQIDALNTTVAKLGDNIGEVAGDLKIFTDDITKRLSNIEIKTSKQGKDALKADLKGIIELARGYRDVMSQGVNVDTSALDKYFIKIKQGFKSLQNSGNPMEMFSDKELANYFVNLTNILRQMGDPVGSLREEFYSLSAAFKTAFEKSGSVGATSVFKDLGYQIEANSMKLRKAQADLAKYEAEIARAQSRIKTTGFAVTVEDDKNLSFEEKIAKIEQYSDIITELDYGEEWATATKNQIALIQAAEKELEGLLKQQNGKDYLKLWQESFGKYDLSDKYSTGAIEDYITGLQTNLIQLEELRQKTITAMAKYESEVGRLIAKDAATASKKTNKHQSVQKQKVDSIAAEVDVKVKVNEEEWRKAINAAITKVESKVKPFKIKVEATSGKILEQVNKIKNASLVDNRKTGASDVSAFDKRFNSFKDNLEKRKNELIEYLKTQWHPTLKDAFSFRFELLGIDKKSLTNNIDTYLVSMVDIINEAMERKPIEFHSNIDTLIEDIQTKIENLELKGNVNLGAGNIGVSSAVPQIVYMLGGGAQGTPIATQAPSQTPPTSGGAPAPVTPSESKKTNKKSKAASKQAAETAEDHARDAYEAGKEIIEYYIRLAKLGKQLSSIREIADKPITADMFNDDELEKWIRGKKYTKEDIGSYAPGKKLTPESLNRFLATMGITEADLAEANTREETEFLGPLKKYIYGFMQNRQTLNALLEQLAQTQSGKTVSDAYNAADGDKTQYLAKNLTSNLTNLMPATPKTKAQQHIADVFKKYNIDLSTLPSAKSYAEQWHIIQTQLIGKEGLDFNNLMSDLGQLKGNVGKTYENFMALLKVSQAYMAASNSLSEVGKEANLLIAGRTETRDKKVKKQNPVTGLWEETGEWSQVSRTVQQGVRGLLKQLQVVIENEAGRTLLGYNLGRGSVPDDVFQSANDSFTQIIKALTTALENSSQILFGKKMSSLEGNSIVARYELPTHKGVEEPYQFTRVSTKKKDIEQQIQNISTLISGYQSTLQRLSDELSSIITKDDNTLSSTEDIKQITQIQTDIRNKESELQRKRAEITQAGIKIEGLQNNLTNPAPLYEDILKALLDEESNLAKLEAELSYKQEHKQTYNDELEIDKLLEQKKVIKNRIRNLNASVGVAALGADDQKVNIEIEKETAEITRLEAELAQKQGSEKAQIEQEIARKKTYIENLRHALKTRERVRPKDAIESELANRQAELARMQEEETQLAEQLSVLNTELTKLGSSADLKRVIEIVSEQKEITDKIAHNQDLLKERQGQLKGADNKKISYNKSYSRAVADLPRAQELLSQAKLERAALLQQYNSALMPFMANLGVKKKTGEIDQGTIDQLIQKLPLLDDLNQQLIQGKITQKDYVDKITEAYIVLRNATTDEVKATAANDAKKLASATLLVKKYQEEEAILKRIIRTQKPKTPEAPKAQTSGAVISSGGDSEVPQQPAAGQAPIGSAGTVTIPEGNVVIGGGVLSGSGLATEDTVHKIYELLSVKRGGANNQYDSKIEELKKAIVAKEAQERAALEAAKQKAAEEKKAAEATKQKVANEQKGTAEIKKKVAEEKKGTSEVKKKNAEEKKGAEAVKKKTEGVQKAEKPGTQSPAKASTSRKAGQVAIKDFFASTYKTYEDVAAGRSVFREQTFAGTKDIIKRYVTGLIANVFSAFPDDYTIRGHRHPENSLYSATDLETMSKRRSRNKSYNTDILITPDFIHQLDGLAKIAPEKITSLYQVFKQFEDSKMNQNLLNKAKESVLHYFAQDNGLSYSKHTYDAAGNLTDITKQTQFLGKEAIGLLKEFVVVLQNNKHNSGAEYKAWQTQKQSLVNKMKQNAELAPLLLDDADAKANEYHKQRMDYQKFRSATLIQEANDFDFDISLFISQFRDFFVALKQLGESVPAGSPLEKLKQYINGISGVEVGSKEYQDILGQIKALSLQVFGKNTNAHLDSRFAQEREIIAERDSSGKIARAMGLKKTSGDVNNEHIPQVTLSELKAELARLEALRDEGQVDPRFATAANQEVIINLLKSGVKIVGKSGASESDAKEKTPDKQEPKKNSEGQTINTARKEVDSAKDQASTTVKDTGDYITKTAQKCGAEILTITKSVKDGVESTTVSMNNDYETAMKKTQEQIATRAKNGLFGAPYDANVDSEMTSAQAVLNSYGQTYRKLEGLIAQFKQLDMSTGVGKTAALNLQPQIDAAQKELDQLETQLIDISNATEKFLGGKEPFKVMNVGALDQTGMSLKLLAQSTENAMVAFNGLYNDGTKLLYDVFDPATSSFKRYSLELDKATGYVRKMETAETGLVNAFQNVNKVQKQSADISAIGEVNQEATLIKKYQEARRQLDSAVNAAWTTAKEENRLISLDEQKEIYALSNEVLRLGKRIISTSNSFKNFKDQGGQSFELLRTGAESLETSMRKLAMDNALDNKMSIGNIAYNDATKKLSYDLTDLYGNVRKVTMSYVEMFNQVKITSDNSVAAIDKVSKSIQDDMVAINNAIDDGLIDTRSDTYTEYTKELQEMLNYRDQLDASDNKLTQSEIDNLNMRKAAVEALGAELVKLAQKNKSSMGQGSKMAQNEINQRVNVDGRLDRGHDLDSTIEYQNYIAAYNAMMNKQEEFRKNGVLTGESEQKQLAAMAEKVAYARRQFEQLSDASAKFFERNTNVVSLESGVDVNNQDAIEAQLKQYAMSRPDLTEAQRKMIEETWEFKNAQDGATYSMRKGTDQVVKMSVEMDRGSRSIGQHAVETTKYMSGFDKFLGSLKNKWQELARYLATFGSFYQVLNLLKQGIQYVREIDGALTELKKVTDETEESYDRFLKTAAKTADKVGSTIKEIVSSTADWARLGYSMEDAAQLAESTSVLLNVSEFSSIEDATSALTSTMQAFGYVAEDSMHVVDVLNEVGNNFSISSDGIATALQDSASALMAANNSYEEAVSLIAAANRVVNMCHVAIVIW